jgi:hypothetical protein
MSSQKIERQSLRYGSDFVKEIHQLLFESWTTRIFWDFIEKNHRVEMKETNFSKLKRESWSGIETNWIETKV